MRVMVPTPSVARAWIALAAALVAWTIATARLAPHGAEPSERVASGYRDAGATRTP